MDTTPKKKSDFLVYSSFGDNSNFYNNWCKRRDNFDIWGTFYGDDETKLHKYKSSLDYVEERKGYKWPNFYHLYHKYKDIISQYKAVWIVDDDILITGNFIRKLFTIINDYDIWILQPAFMTHRNSVENGKVSWKITKQVKQSYLRYTNFIEMNCPMFKTDKLIKFMEYYSPEVQDHGIDFLFIYFLGMYEVDKYAIVDRYPCFNPIDERKKDSIREATFNQSFEDKENEFIEFVKNHNIDYSIHSLGNRELQKTYKIIQKNYYMGFLSKKHN